MSCLYDIVILGLTITSSWGNGHATTYRGLIKELKKSGHSVLFLERDMPWYAMNRDLIDVPYCNIELYGSISELKRKYYKYIRDAEIVVVGSYVPDGIIVCDWVVSIASGLTAFYDIDTPVTITKLKSNSCDYLSQKLISQFDLYLSFAGGPILEYIEKKYGAPIARPLYCSVDPEIYYPEMISKKYDMGYMGTYSIDRQNSLNILMIDAARKLQNARFIIAGPQYPVSQNWPENVLHTHHIPPSAHREFYCSQRFTLNLTRADMISSGYAPSVRLFEAAACGIPIISDYWEGLDSIFSFGDEILLSKSTETTIHYLEQTSSNERDRIGLNARKKVLTSHTSAHRAVEFESYLHETYKIKYRV